MKERRGEKGETERQGGRGEKEDKLAVGGGTEVVVVTVLEK